MKYKDFYTFLTLKTGHNASIGPSISIRLKEPSISMSNKEIDFNHKRFIIFPIKIYGENVQHLNILFLDRKTKIMERYEPFNQYLNFNQINDLLEPLLYKLMEQKKIYFLKYQTTLNQDNIIDDTNCGIYCIKYVVEKLKSV